MNLPHIRPTCPGDKYEIDIKYRYIENAVLVRSRIDLASYCRNILDGQLTICELGVYKGDFSAYLLDRFKPQKCYLIDIDPSKINISVRLQPNVIIKKGLSWEVLAELPDQSIDYLYVDADHSTHGISKDITVAHQKIKPGGIIQFNDYCTYSPGEGIEYGVLNVVNSYIENHNITILGLSLDRSGYHDIAVRKCL